MPNCLASAFTLTPLARAVRIASTSLSVRRVRGRLLGSAAAPISDQKIEQFADAYVAVQNIQEKAASELQTAKDPAAADQVKQSAESDMIAAVEKSGLKVDEFNQIVETMTADASVRERVAAKLQERQGGGGSP